MAAAAAPAAREPDPVRGLFSGGTLCYEAQLVLERLLGPVYSNEPLRAGAGPAGARRCATCCSTSAPRSTRRGVPHPMIDPSGRLRAAAPSRRDDPAVAVVLLDVVLGHGAHEDPAGLLAPVCAELMAAAARRSSRTCSAPRRTRRCYSRQRAVLEEAGCIVPETNARAAYAAAALALRRPELAEEDA